MRIEIAGFNETQQYVVPVKAHNGLPAKLSRAII